MKECKTYKFNKFWVLEPISGGHSLTKSRVLDTKTFSSISVKISFYIRDKTSACSTTNYLWGLNDGYRGEKVWKLIVGLIKLRLHPTLNYWQVSNLSGDCFAEKYLTMKILRAFWKINWKWKRGCFQLTFPCFRSGFPECFSGVATDLFRQKIFAFLCRSFFEFFLFYITTW